MYRRANSQLVRNRRKQIGRDHRLRDKAARQHLWNLADLPVMNAFEGQRPISIIQLKIDVQAISWLIHFIFKLDLHSLAVEEVRCLIPSLQNANAVQPESRVWG